MEWLTQFGISASWVLLVVVAFVVLLTVVVFVHEMGHFLVARWCGVTVKAFSIGFGKEIFAFVDRHGTRWRVAWIPLGGYVKFMDDENAASVPSRDSLESLSDEERAGAFQLKPLWQRAAVVAAGPIANFLLAILIFAGLFMVHGVTKMEPRIAGLVEGMPAEKAGFKTGDLVREIDGREIDSFADIQQVVAVNVGRTLEFIVERGGQNIVLQAAPVLIERDDPIAGKHERPAIGIKGSTQVSTMVTNPVGPIEAVALGAERTWVIITTTLSFIGDVFAQRQSPDQIGGVVRIADVAGKVAAHGIVDLIFYTAFISVSIGLINLFPIPLLDGGHLMFYAFEAVLGRPLSENAQEIGFRVGLVLIIMLMAFGFYNDRGILANWLSGLG